MSARMLVGLLVWCVVVRRVADGQATDGFEPDGRTANLSADALVRQPRGERVAVQIEVLSDDDLAWRRIAVVQGAELHPNCNGQYEPAAHTKSRYPVVFTKEEGDLAIYRWHAHYWIIGAVNHDENAEDAAASAPVGALYMAPAGSPPSDLPPVYGWTDGAPYVIARQSVQSRFNRYIQAFGCMLLFGFVLCHVAVHRRAAAQEVAQQRRRVALVEMAHLRRTGRAATREREMAQEAAHAEAWESSWLYPFWHMRGEAAGMPKLVQVIQPGDADFELGVVLEKLGLDSEPHVLQPDSTCGAAADDDDEDDGKQPGDSDARLSSAALVDGADASTTDTADVAALDGEVDNPLRDVGTIDDRLEDVQSV